jgi:putative endonuclease
MAFYVYMLASKKHGTLYLGVTNNIVRRTYDLPLKPVVMDSGLGPRAAPE